MTHVCLGLDQCRGCIELDARCTAVESEPGEKTGTRTADVPGVGSPRTPGSQSA